MVRKAPVRIQLCQSQVRSDLFRYIGPICQTQRKTRRWSVILGGQITDIILILSTRSGSVQSVETVGNSEGTNTSNGTETSGASQTPSCRYGYMYFVFSLLGLVFGIFKRTHGKCSKDIRSLTAAKTHEESSLKGRD